VVPCQCRAAVSTDKKEMSGGDSQLPVGRRKKVPDMTEYDRALP